MKLTDDTDFWEDIVNEKHESYTGEVAKCNGCNCLVPKNFIEDNEKCLCYMCTPMTKEDWKSIYIQ